MNVIYSIEPGLPPDGTCLPALHRSTMTCATQTRENSNSDIQVRLVALHVFGLFSLILFSPHNSLAHPPSKDATPVVGQLLQLCLLQTRPNTSTTKWRHRSRSATSQFRFFDCIPLLLNRLMCMNLFT